MFNLFKGNKPVTYKEIFESAGFDWSDNGGEYRGTEKALFVGSVRGRNIYFFGGITIAAAYIFIKTLKQAENQIGYKIRGNN